MVPNLTRKIFGIVALSGLAIWSFLSFPVNLGLDLQGGARIVYRLDFDKAVEEGQISANEDRTLVLQDTIAIFLKRLDGSGLVDVPIYPQGEDGIVIEMPGKDAEVIDAVKKTIVNQGSLQFRIVADATDDLAITEETEKYRTWRAGNPEEQVTAFNRVAEGEGGPRTGLIWVGVNGESADTAAAPGLDATVLRDEDAIRGTESGSPLSWNFTGAGLSYVGPGADDAGFPAVRFEFAEHRKAAFADFTQEFRQRRMAIVLNNQVESAPVIQGRLPGGGIITGGAQGFASDEMRELITVLRTGSLKIRPELESQSFVGSQLGEDSIQIGLRSALVGAVLVLLFMLFYYRINGMVACLSLIFNGFLLFGALSFTQATLTLPGLAGLVLTIGMAVDANILIFERVREERKRGRETPQAYKNGYDRAFTTIIDANLTTLITSLILFKVGTGPVQGFAATLSLGVITSVFSALVFSKVLMHFLVFRKQGFINEVSMTGALADNAKIKFLAKRRIAAVLSIVLITAGLVNFSRSGSAMLGIDFTGGSVARVLLAEPTPIGEVRARLVDGGYTVTRFESADDDAGADVSNAFLIKLKAFTTQGEGEMEGETFIESDLRTRLEGMLAEKDPFPEINTIGQRVSGEIQQAAIQAILLSLIAIVIYMNFRFKEYRFGLAAVVALFHDVLFTLGALAVFHQLGLVRVEINLEIIAAFLTIIGYSLNDTIVVFDRIRENLPRMKGSFIEVIDRSINQSLNRTILTSVTTFFVVGVLFFSNRPLHNVLEGFAFAMLIGVVVGTYSSMFVASPLLVFLDRWARNKKIASPSAKG